MPIRGAMAMERVPLLAGAPAGPALGALVAQAEPTATPYEFPLIKGAYEAVRRRRLTLHDHFASLQAPHVTMLGD